VASCFVSWDDDLIDALFRRGDFAVAAAIADAWSAGVLQRLHVGGAARDVALAADCLAGAWTGALSRGEILDQHGESIATLSAGDLDEAVAGFLFQSGTVGGDAAMRTAMTSAFDRTAAFQSGFEGTVTTCVS